MQLRDEERRFFSRQTGALAKSQRRLVNLDDEPLALISTAEFTMTIPQSLVHILLETDSLEDVFAISWSQEHLNALDPRIRVLERHSVLNQQENFIQIELNPPLWTEQEEERFLDNQDRVERIVSRSDFPLHDIWPISQMPEIFYDSNKSVLSDKILKTVILSLFSRMNQIWIQMEIEVNQKSFPLFIMFKGKGTIGKGEFNYLSSKGIIEFNKHSAFDTKNPYTTIVIYFPSISVFNSYDSLITVVGVMFHPFPFYFWNLSSNKINLIVKSESIEIKDVDSNYRYIFPLNRLLILAL